MTISHHLDTATVLAYAAGSLDDCLSVVAACHVAMCEECQVEVHQAEAIGGAMLETAGSIELSTELLQGAMDIINQGDTLENALEDSSVLQENIRAHGCFHRLPSFCIP